MAKGIFRPSRACAGRLGKALSPGISNGSGPTWHVREWAKRWTVNAGTVENRPRTPSRAASQHHSGRRRVARSPPRRGLTDDSGVLPRHGREGMRSTIDRRLSSSSAGCLDRAAGHAEIQPSPPTARPKVGGMTIRGDLTNSKVIRRRICQLPAGGPDRDPNDRHQSARQYAPGLGQDRLRPGLLSATGEGRTRSLEGQLRGYPSAGTTGSPPTWLV